MVLSCSWIGEYTSVKMLHLKGGSSGILSKRSVSPFSWQRGGNVNEIDSGCQTESLNKTSKSSQWASSTASGNQQIFQWASTNFLVGSQQKRSSEQFSAQQKQKWVVFVIISQWALNKFWCWFHAKDRWILLQLGTWWSCQATFRDESDIQLTHVLFWLESFQLSALAVFQAAFLRINSFSMRTLKMVPSSYFGLMIEGGNVNLFHKGNYKSKNT